jgi:drug/metabolite transporter (DMT)-like permease
MSDAKKTRAIFLLLLTSAIWGFAFVAQVAGVRYVGSFTFGGVRFALGAVSLIPVICVFERKTGGVPARRLTWLGGAVAGAVLFIAATVQQFGVAIIGSSGRAGFITGLYTVIVPIIGIFLGKRPRGAVWVGAALACAGLYLLCAPAGLSGAGGGDALLLIGALFWALHIIVIDRYADRVSPLRFSAIQFAVCSALSILCALIFEDVSLASIVAGRVPILYGGLLSVGVAYTIQTVGQRDVEPARAAIIFSTESLFSAIGGAILLSETMSPVNYAGCALIFAGIITAQIRFGRRLSKRARRGAE